MAHIRHITPDSSDTIMNQDKEFEVEVRRGKENKAKVLI